jgi:hypothetical protein
MVLPPVKRLTTSQGWQLPGEPSRNRVSASPPSAGVRTLDRVRERLDRALPEIVGRICWCRLGSP